jgi:fatty-acyl-CoA synthase
MYARALHARLDPLAIEELVQPTRLHASLYTSQQIFQLELERIWRRCWIYVCHDSEIEEPGSYVTRQVGDQPVILVRDREGELHALFNRCAHRGATVCQEQSGRSSSFRCAYHGWAYKLDGQLIGAPYQEGYGPDFDKSKHGLARVPRLDSYRGFMFVSLRRDGESLVEHLGDAKDYIDRFVELSPTGKVRLNGGSLKSSVQGNWKMVAENIIDAYHGPFLHRSSLPGLLQQGLTMHQVFGEDSVVRTIDIGHGHAFADFTPQNRATRGTLLSYNGGVTTDIAGEYVAELAQRTGEARARQLVEDGLCIIRIFPNLGLLGQDVRYVTPIAPDHSLLVQTPALVVGTSEAVKAANRGRIAVHTTMYSACGRVGPDDLEVYERTQHGLQALKPEWVHIRRGTAEEKSEGGWLIGNVTAETAIRSFWRRYREEMSSGGSPS